jgi:hypothetical protein
MGNGTIKWRCSMNQIIPIIMILICVFGGAITLFFFKKSKSGE